MSGFQTFGLGEPINLGLDDEPLFRVGCNTNGWWAEYLKQNGGTHRLYGATAETTLEQVVRLIEDLRLP